MIIRNTASRTLAATTLAAAAVAAALPAHAADELNVAYFLEWATPNMVAKADGLYESTLGIPVNWTAFDTGTQMTEAMLSGDIDIAYSQGLAPFIAAVNADTPIQMVGIAVEYPANDCVVRSDAGITADNASELEGESVAVPLATMADYSFRMQMRELGVDVSQIQIIDQAPADAAVSLADGSVAMACGFGGLAMAKMYESGEPLMDGEQKEAAGIISFDVVSVSNEFAQDEPALVRSFLEITDRANAAFENSDDQLEKLSTESGMTVDGVKTQMEGFTFPSIDEQLTRFFGDDGLATKAIGIVGDAFATPDQPALEDYSGTVNTSFLEE